MSTLGQLIANVAVWGCSGVLIGWLFARQDWRTIAAPGFFTRLRRWERRRRYERLFLVRRWKDRLPEAGTWFGGITKRRLPKQHDGGTARFAAESLRAERVHLVFLLVFAVSISWNGGWWWFVNVVVGVLVNVPCIVVARYNRIRVAHLT